MQGYKSSSNPGLKFRFPAELWPLELSKFVSITVFWSFLRYAWMDWTVTWYVALSCKVTNQDWIPARNSYSLQSYGPLNLKNIRPSQFHRLFFTMLPDNDFQASGMSKITTKFVSKIWSHCWHGISLSKWGRRRHISFRGILVGLYWLGNHYRDKIKHFRVSWKIERE